MRVYTLHKIQLTKNSDTNLLIGGKKKKKDHRQVKYILHVAITCTKEKIHRSNLYFTVCFFTGFLLAFC